MIDKQGVDERPSRCPDGRNGLRGGFLRNLDAEALCNFNDQANQSRRIFFNQPLFSGLLNMDLFEPFIPSLFFPKFSIRIIFTIIYDLHICWINFSSSSFYLGSLQMNPYHNRIQRIHFP